ncbi:ADP-glyceromanno-heptose 6-epimerase [Blochmannia endosymbiont of Camponotus sp.]|uniref:ADP-glyceromanno-heptose 6-epimerase n=1 Tax=Blochmannia endosymbiont of Camponotus sp. TaxID=700220 RepID=UPI002024D856|nr:ADP-glyceromanno-heptose 6-epimerase [Blochmannia endosymbiont of Camponotus sp.]URJ23910.1 ADP-glyceromanno-heptose 6-epimerase [Blochmannia endosymbiont of Camponotus sp.]URJ25894.1 ADP-glyceromanno-heptose 6-epimerase [Blochmannia endosymbiont of Camponotus sp.]
MIVVTGGAGFIGCNIIKSLNKIAYKNILVVDNLKNGKKYNNLKNLYISDYIDKNCFINNILNNPVNSYIKDIAVVFHEGACSSTTEWDGKYMMENNYQYSKDLLFYCVKNKIPFIYASSASVYGKDTRVLLQSHTYEQPMNIYSYSKFLFDQYVRAILPKVASQVCGLRYFNVYGPCEAHKGSMASIIFQLYQQIISKKHPTLFIGSKQLKRDFIHIEDIVDINLWAWNNNISGIFDCGTGKSESFECIANIVLSFFDQNVTIKYISMPKQIRDHYQIFTQANISQLREAGYCKKFIDLNQGICRYLNWLSCNNVEHCNS